MKLKGTKTDVLPVVFSIVLKSSSHVYQTDGEKISCCDLNFKFSNGNEKNKFSAIETNK